MKLEKKKKGSSVKKKDF